MSTRLLIGIACAAALALGVGMAQGLRDAPASRAAEGSSDPVSALEAELARLRERLDAERASREALAAEVAMLRESLAALAPAPAAPAGGAGASAASEPVDGAEAGDVEAAGSPPTHAERGVVAFDPAALLAAGFSESEVEALRVRVDEMEMARLYLRDRAAREDWLGTPRFREEMRALGVAQQGLRQEFGEELYDWMLYAGGSPNRVAVGGLLEGSPAGAAGMRPGDVILRYADENVYNPLELRQATLRGESGASVAVDLDRDGQRIRVYVPRGPLGVRLEGRAVEPPPR